MNKGRKKKKIRALGDNIWLDNMTEILEGYREFSPETM